MRDESLLTLAAVFVPMSLLSFGGGQAIVAEVHRQMVTQHHWLTESDFLGDYVLSRMAPGPTSLMVMLMGHQVAGLPGAAVSVAAMFLPSSLLVFGVASVWRRHHGAAWRVAVERGLTPIACGLVLASSLTLLRSLEGGWPAWLLAGLATLCLFTMRVHPLVLIGAGSALFLGLGALSSALH